MYRAIQDYLCSGRCEWMQKWPGMCVLNASQLHWTAETEELLIEQGGEAPQTMLTRQVISFRSWHVVSFVCVSRNDWLTSFFVRQPTKSAIDAQK